MTNQAPTSRVAQLEAALAEISRPMDIAAIMAKPEPTAQEILEWRRHEIEIGNFGEGSAYDKVFTLAAVAVIKLQEARTHAAGLQAQLEGADILIGGTAKLAADLRAQVATLHQEQARLTELLESKCYSDTTVLAETPESYATLVDHYREMSRRFAESRDELKHKCRTLTRERDEAQQECQTAEAACADLMDVAEAAERQIAAVRDFCTADSGWAWEDEACLRVLALLDAPTLLPASPPETARAEEPDINPTTAGTELEGAQGKPETGNERGTPRRIPSPQLPTGRVDVVPASPTPTKAPR